MYFRNAVVVDEAVAKVCFGSARIMSDFVMMQISGAVSTISRKYLHVNEELVWCLKGKLSVDL